MRFNYNRTSDEQFNSLVDCTLELARSCYAGNKPADYAEKNAELLNAMGKKVVEGTRFEASYEVEGLRLFKQPMFRNNSMIRDNFNAVIAQVVNAIVPEVVNDQYARFLSEVKQVGYGETARFIIQSNDLFKVNEKAEGVRKGVDQPMYDDEFTVNARPITID